MKTHPFFRRKHSVVILVVLLWSFFIITYSTFSAVPQPACIYYGQARDGYGWPYEAEAKALLFSGTNLIAQYEITGAIAPGINFMLTVNLEDHTGGIDYDPRALHPGDPVSIRIQDRYGQKTIMESNAVPNAGQPGEIFYICVTAGTDSSGDGLPDEWKQEILEYNRLYGVQPAITNIAGILPDDDFDSDGISNKEEYQAGTFAFLDYDYFHAESIKPAQNGRIKITFLSVPGKAYSLLQTTDLVTGSWTDAPYALSAEDSLQSGAVTGTGSWLHLFVPATNNPVFKLEVQ
jgi:hypothetical protein